MDHEGKWLRRSPFGVDETLNRLQAAIAKVPGIVILTRIDQAAELSKIGKSTRPCQNLLFENRMLVSRFYDHDPASLFWFPISALAWEDNLGQSWLRVTDPDRLQRDSGGAGMEETFETIHRILGDLVQQTISGAAGP